MPSKFPQVVQSIFLKSGRYVVCGMRINGERDVILDLQLAVDSKYCVTETYIIRV